ncbi:transposase [Pseudomonas jessenii]
MKWFGRLIGLVCRDNRSSQEQARDRAFIAALNNLKSLRVTPEGGMSIDPDEIREKVIASRQSLKRFVR